MIAEIKRRCCVERTQNRRNQVLEAAECCFARSGFHGASMAEISKAAGMSAGHIYNYFESKDDIIAAFVQRNMDRVTTIISEIEARDDPLQAMLDDLEEASARTTLSLTHLDVPADMLGAVGAGWEYYVDRLVAALRGDDVAAIDFETDYFPALADRFSIPPEG